MARLRQHLRFHRGKFGTIIQVLKIRDLCPLAHTLFCLCRYHSIHSMPIKKAALKKTCCFYIQYIFRREIPNSVIGQLLVSRNVLPPSNIDNMGH